jgi:hypothetical protein
VNWAKEQRRSLHLNSIKENDQEEIKALEAFGFKQRGLHIHNGFPMKH